MLQLRPICENCAKPLPPQADDARICTYECTFCADCVANVLHNVCPNCGGGFEKRPIRPATSWRPKTSLSFDPPSSKRLHKPINTVEHDAYSSPIRHLKPVDR
jgi:uncharacterized protein